MKYLKDFTLTTTLIIGLVGCGESIEVSSSQTKAALSDTKEVISHENKVAEMGEIIREAKKKIEANPNMSEEDQKKVMMDTLNKSPLAQKQLEKQKIIMPKIVKLVTTYRDCLTKANSKKDAQKCEESGRKMAKTSGITDLDEEEEENKEAWTKEGREELIEELTREIISMEKALPCIEKSTNMMDIMQCQKY